MLQTVDEQLQNDVKICKLAGKRHHKCTKNIHFLKEK